MKFSTCLLSLLALSQASPISDIKFKETVAKRNVYNSLNNIFSDLPELVKKEYEELDLNELSERDVLEPRWFSKHNDHDKWWDWFPWGGHKNHTFPGNFTWPHHPDKPDKPHKPGKPGKHSGSPGKGGHHFKRDASLGALDEIDEVIEDLQLRLRSIEGLDKKDDWKIIPFNSFSITKLFSDNHVAMMEHLDRFEDSLYTNNIDKGLVKSDISELIDELSVKLNNLVMQAKKEGSDSQLEKVNQLLNDSKALIEEKLSGIKSKLSNNEY